jgi:hypothetical protein
MNKMRNERLDLIKKLQHQKDESDKALQKQIEFKELENQFKAQELMELTMKYKCLESAVKKNPNSAVQITATQQQFSPQHHHHYQNQHQQPPSTAHNQQHHHQVNVNLQNQFKAANLPQKRMLVHSAGSDNDENEQPDVKRPTPASRSNIVLQNKTNVASHNNSSGALPTLASNTNSFVKTAAKSSDQLTSSSAVNLSTPITSHKSEPPKSMALTATTTTPSTTAATPKPTVVEQKKATYSGDIVLKTKLSAYYPNLLRLISAKPSEDSSSIYTMCEHVNDLARYLAQFNAANRPSDFSLSNLTKFFILNDRLSKFVKMLDTLDMHRAAKSHITSRIDSLFSTLNKELTHLLLNYFLFTAANEHYNVNILMLLVSQQTAANQAVLQKTFRLCVDLACMTFESILKLYVFRMENGESGVTLTSGDEVATNELYAVVLGILRFINFSKLFGTGGGSVSGIGDNSLSTSSASYTDGGSGVVNTDSCLSYLILKLLNAVLDCFNLFSGRRSSGFASSPFGRENCMYASLLDNLHNVSNKKYVWYYFKSEFFLIFFIFELKALR